MLSLLSIFDIFCNIMGKERVSATIDPETSRVLEKIMKNGKYRNKSHLIEEAIRFFAEENKEK